MVFVDLKKVSDTVNNRLFEVNLACMALEDWHFKGFQLIWKKKQQYVQVDDIKSSLCMYLCNYSDTNRVSKDKIML